MTVSGSNRNSNSNSNSSWSSDSTDPMTVSDNTMLYSDHVDSDEGYDFDSREGMW